MSSTLTLNPRDISKCYKESINSHKQKKLNANALSFFVYDNVS